MHLILSEKENECISQKVKLLCSLALHIPLSNSTQNHQKFSFSMPASLSALSFLGFFIIYCLKKVKLAWKFIRKVKWPENAEQSQTTCSTILASLPFNKDWSKLKGRQSAYSVTVEYKRSTQNNKRFSNTRRQKSACPLKTLIHTTESWYDEWKQTFKRG